MAVNQREIQVELPAAPCAEGVFAACVRAMLARIDSLTEPDAVAAALFAAAAEPLRRAIVAAQAEPATRIPMTLAVVAEPHSLVVTLGAAWQQRIALPDLAQRMPTVDAEPPSTGSPNLGVGIYLVQQLMDEVDYQPGVGGNHWLLRKRLPGSALPENAAHATVQEPSRAKSSVVIDLPATYRELSVLAACTTALLTECDRGQLPADELGRTVSEIELVVQEIGNAIVEHAYAGKVGRIRAEVTRGATDLLIDIKDEGENRFSLSDLAMPVFPTTMTDSSIFAGSAMLFASMTFVNIGNYLYNLILGRWLGPVRFAELSLIVTLMLVVTLVTSTFQTITAKFAAVHTANGNWVGLAGLQGWLGRRAWVLGGVVMGLLVLGAPLLSRFFHTGSIWPFVLLAVGAPIYFAQGVDRGVLQGRTRLGPLMVSYQVEMWVRLVVGVALVALGYAVNGAVLGITLSFAATWLVARRALVDVHRLPDGPMLLSPRERRLIRTFAIPVALALTGQVLINNSDILIVKRFFPDEAAGHYAALALIGRMVFFATWSVVTMLFPIVAQKQERGERHRHLLLISLGLVTLVAGGIVVVTYAVPELIVSLLFGAAYAPIASLLWLYAIATALFAMANVVVSYRLSAGNGQGSILVAAGGVMQVIALWLFHADLRQVVVVQIWVMGFLLAGLLLWDLWLEVARRRVRPMVSP